MNINISKKDFKSVVKKISDKIKNDNVDIKYSEILEIASQACGFKNYNTIKSYFSKFKKKETTFCFISYTEDNKKDDIYLDEDEEDKKDNMYLDEVYSKDDHILNEINKISPLKENESNSEIFGGFLGTIHHNKNFTYNLYDEGFNLNNTNFNIKNLLFYNVNISIITNNFYTYVNYPLLYLLYSSDNFYYYCFENNKGKFNRVEDLIKEILYKIEECMKDWGEKELYNYCKYFYHNYYLICKKIKSFSKYETCFFKNNKIISQERGI